MGFLTARKKIGAAVMAASLFLPFAGATPTAEAGWLSSVLRDSVLSSIEKSISGASSSVRKKALPLDGSSVKGKRSSDAADGTQLAEYSFSVDGPTLVTFQASSTGEGGVRYRILDGDGNFAGGTMVTAEYGSAGGGAESYALLTKGNYRVVTLAEGEGGSAEYEISAATEAVEINAPIEERRVEQAIEISLGEEVRGMFPTGVSQYARMHWYKFYVGNGGDFYWRMKRLAPTGGYEIHLYDEANAEKIRRREGCKWEERVRFFQENDAKGTEYTKIMNLAPGWHYVSVSCFTYETPDGRIEDSAYAFSFTPVN